MDKRIFEKKRSVIGSMLIALLVASGCTPTELPQDVTTANPGCSVSAEEFDNWFKSGAVSLNGEVVPADSTQFSDQPFCDFYAWSEQMFLWLTSPAPPSYGGGSAPIFNSPAFFSVSGQEDGKRHFKRNEAGGISPFATRGAQVGLNRLPTVIERQTLEMFEILLPERTPGGNPLVQDNRGRMVEVGTFKMGDKRSPMFFDKNGKEIRGARPIFPKHMHKQQLVQKFSFNKTTILLKRNGTVLEPEIAQANFNKPVVMTQGESLVYYTTTVNQVYAYFLTGVKNGEIDVPPQPGPNNDVWDGAQFPTSAADLAVVTDYAESHGVDILDPNALAIEVKTSWVEAATLDNPGDYIIMNAKIPTFTADASNETWTQNGTKLEKLALIGIHVVGSTVGHPEMLWATFEHVNNTPNVGYDFINNDGQTAVVPSDAGGDGWLLSSNTTAGPFNEIHMTFGDSGEATEILATEGFTISPSDTQRLFPWGNDADDAASNTRLISINNSVRNKLLEGDVRGNYIQIGTTWTIGGQDPHNGGTPVGTNQLANSTMETYDIGSNCFSCHGTNRVDVSHIFDPLEPLFEE